MKDEHRISAPLRRAVPNLELMSQRLYQRGGAPQQHRMIEDKRRTLARAVHYSYQGGFIKKTGEDTPWCRGLINPDKLKQDYDSKIISFDPKAYMMWNEDHSAQVPIWDIQVGDVFDWMNTGTKWLVYLQDLTELAYFRADIRRCRYLIKWKDAEGNMQGTYAAIRGPVETKINYIQKSGDSVDTPNHSLNLLVPYTKANYEFFRRYARFYLQLGIDRESKDRELDQKICWRVEAVNSVSAPGIIEVTAVEYYANKDKDDIENGIADGLLEPLEDPNVEGEYLLIGPTFINSQCWETYQCEEAGPWSIEAGRHHVDLQSIDDKTVKVRWPYPGKGEFTLKCGIHEKKIVVKSLF